MSPGGDSCSVEALWPAVVDRLSEPEAAVRESIYQTLRSELT